VPLFMDYHDNLKLPAEAIEQIAEGTRDGATDDFGVRQVELYQTPTGRSTASSMPRTSRPSVTTMLRSASPAVT
jgi:hypothetical protein